MFKASCRNCRFSLPVARTETSSVCRIDPPTLTVSVDGRNTGSFPPVHVDLFTCGKRRRRPWWWRLVGR